MGKQVVRAVALPVRAEAIGAGALILALAAAMAMPGHAQEKVIVSHAITTFGDPPKYPADFKHLDYVNPDAPKGGEISFWAQGNFDSLNAYSYKGVPAAGSTIMHESILTGTADEIGTSYCLMCTTMEYPEDRSWVIFHLRPEVAFSDGTPMTAEDVIFSYETFLAKGLTDFRSILGQQVDKVEALDAHTVKFSFKPGFPTRDLPETVGGLPILSKADYQARKLDMEESTLQPWLGTGPYMFEKMDTGRNIVYKRNPDYWGRDLPINVGRNNFDRIRYEYFADPNAAFEGFKAGAYTFRNENSSKSWATSYDFPAIQNGTIIKAELPSGNKANGQAFMFNLRREKFQDPRVRAAIALMFNFEWSNKTLFYDLYARINSIWENSDMAATGVPTEGEVALLKPLVEKGLLPESILTDEAVMAPVSGEKQLDRANLRKASALLDEAGWTVGDDGKRRNAKGEVLTVEFLNDSPAFERVINPYVENLKALGIEARLTNVDPSQGEARTTPPAFDFDMITDNARSSYISGADLMQVYGSASAENSGFNIMGLKSPAVDSLAQTVMTADSMDSLKTATKALDRVLRAEQFWVPQWYKNTYTVAYYDQYGHPETLPPYALGEGDFWWFDSDKAAKLKASGALK